MKRIYLFFAILGAAAAQQVVAPTPEQVGPPRAVRTWAAITSRNRSRPVTASVPWLVIAINTAAW